MSYPSIHWIFLSAGRPSLTTCNRGFMLLRGSYQATNNSRVYAIKYVVNLRGYVHTFMLSYCNIYLCLCDERLTA